MVAFRVLLLIDFGNQLIKHPLYSFLKDIYIAAVSSAHSVCAKNYYVAIVSTLVETSNPEKECEPGLALLGTISERYFSIS
jgi:RAB protein geranylgeranyltransferase component A